MSRQLARQLVRYRNILVALANAAITWVILIIAPLGLFAVINCTVMVFLASLVTGFLGDLALTALLDSVDPQLGKAVRGDVAIDPNRRTPLTGPDRQELPRPERGEDY